MTYLDDRSNVTYKSATVSYNSADTTYNGLISSEERVYFGDKLGGVYHFDYGNTMDTKDIAFRLVTKDYYMGNPSIYKYLSKLVVYCDGGRQVTIQYKLDDGDWKTLGRLSDSITTLVFPSSTQCRKVKFRVIESSSGDAFNFEGFDIYFKPGGLVE
jgi:hypothetical protein